MDTSILITGGDGFIASYLKLALAEYNVYAPSKNELDVTNSLANIGKPDIIFHLAANTSSQFSLEYPVVDFRTNALGTINVLEFARKTGARVIYPSTQKVIPNENKQMSPYGLSKKVAELACLEWHYTYGIPVIVTRFSGLYGEGGDKFWVNHFIKRAAANEKIEVWGDGNASRDMLYVEDAVRLLIDQMEHFDDYPPFLEAGGGVKNKITINQLLRKLNYNNVEYKSEMSGDKKELCVDNAKVTAIRGWKPEININEGIEGLIKYYDHNHRHL